MDITHHRSFYEVLNSFMEESNIRWGEITGGMLLMGAIFLLLSIVTMIWYASANFGFAILLTFAVFEKKRHTADLRG